MQALLKQSLHLLLTSKRAFALDLVSEKRAVTELSMRQAPDRPSEHCACLHRVERAHAGKFVRSDVTCADMRRVDAKTPHNLRSRDEAMRVGSTYVVESRIDQHARATYTRPDTGPTAVGAESG